jgi:starch synthase (maltosyl-transferring)
VKPELSADRDAGRRRPVIERVDPEIEGGRFPIKRTVGQRVAVRASVFVDGHDYLACVLKYRQENDSTWREVPMQFLRNDRWEAEFRVDEMVRHYYTLEAWVDRFQTWQRELAKRVDAGQRVPVELHIGAALVQHASLRAPANDADRLQESARYLAGDADEADRVHFALSGKLADLMATYPDRRFSTTYDKELTVVVDRPRARFSSWYEIFPRSTSPEPGRHGTFQDLERLIPRIVGMGFDVIYLPPIHPIGFTFRKGPNNTPGASPSDPGSPWAIGSEAGGHQAVHPELGTLDDFRRLVQTAQDHGAEIALDIAYQCSPDHPYVREHREWFRLRPDGTVQYAENPPKKYEDIYPFDFETERWRELWNELKSIILFWIEHGVRIFRVDNPHTKPFALWESLIESIKDRYPETIFLAEAFTRPAVMYRLAKLGFTQSYTYFTWRNTKEELTEYFSMLTDSEVREYFRPNLWPNTPDILTEYLQFGGRAACMTRLVLAATLGANYGVYGPPLEHCETQPREPGSEEYLDSEKYQIRHWDFDDPDTLREFMERLNGIRRENAALQSDLKLQFHTVENPQLIAYSKQSEDGENLVVVVVNLDSHHTQSGWLELPLEELEIEPDRPYQMHDLLGGGRYLWNGPWNYVELDPRVVPAHVFQVRRRVRTERQFEYFM